jgi:hypothetical protein
MGLPNVSPLFLSDGSLLPGLIYPSGMAAQTCYPALPGHVLEYPALPGLSKWRCHFVTHPQ